MMGLISKHENSHAVSMFTRGGETKGDEDIQFMGVNKKLDTLHPAQNILLLPECLNLRTMCCATMESDALIYLPSFELALTSSHEKLAIKIMLC